MNKKKILITGAGGVGILSIYIYFKKKYILYFADSNINNINPKIPKKYCYEIPLANHNSYQSKILHLYNKLKIDLLIPTVDEELEMISSLKTVNSLIPSFDFIKIFNNKLKTSKFLKEKKLSHPEVINFQRNINKKNIKYPLILKPIYGRGSKGIIILNNYDELKFYIKKLNISSKNYIIQKYIKGIEFSVQMISDKLGNLISIVPVKIIEKKGITIEAILDFNNNLIQFCKKFHEIFKTKSTYNIQLIMNNKKKFFIIEVNPRISTTHIFTLLLNIDPIEIYFNKKNVKNINKIVKKKIKIKRFYETYIIY